MQKPLDVVIVVAHNFKNGTIYLNNNFLTKKNSYVGIKNDNYIGFTNDYELNNGKSHYKILELEIYHIIFE